MRQGGRQAIRHVEGRHVGGQGRKGGREAGSNPGKHVGIIKKKRKTVKLPML